MIDQLLTLDRGIYQHTCQQIGRYIEDQKDAGEPNCCIPKTADVVELWHNNGHLEYVR